MEICTGLSRHSLQSPPFPLLCTLCCSLCSTKVLWASSPLTAWLHYCQDGASSPAFPLQESFHLHATVITPVNLINHSLHGNNHF